MKPAAVRLLVVSGLFFLWLGYLGWQVIERPRTDSGWPLVLSRPQIMTSQVDVIAYIEDPRDKIVVKEVLYPSDSPLKEGAKIAVSELNECQPVGRDKQKPPKDWSGPGLYLVPLLVIDARQGEYRVAPIPPSPGFRGSDWGRIYPDGAQTRAQYRQIEKP